MAVVKQCDRCGKFYNHYAKRKLDRYNAFRLVRTNESDTLEIPCPSLFDLCEQCMRELGDFMNLRDTKKIDSLSKEDKSDDC